MEPVGEVPGDGRVLYLMNSPVSPAFISLASIDPSEGGKWRPEQQDSEDHGLWSGSGMAPNHEDECGRDLRLDGSRSHSRLHVFQRQ